MRHFIVKDGDKEKEVIIAGTPEEMKDQSHMDYLEAAGREKALDELRKMPDKPKPTASKRDIAEALKERIEFRDRARRGGIQRKYF